MEIPARFPSTGTDAATAITRSVTLHRIGLRLSFRERCLDPTRLARAVRLSFDAEPILGCAFATDERRAYWSRLPEIDVSKVFSARESTNPDAEMIAFQSQEVTDEGPQAAVLLLRTDDSDILGIKVSHVAADGQAAKQYAYLLADIYSRLGTDPAYVPEPNLRQRPTGRDVWGNLTQQQRRDAKKAKSWTNPTWTIPSKGEGRGGLTYRSTGLQPDDFAFIKAYGKERGSTINDMMLTAVLRACIDAFDPPTGVPLSLMCTSDLRRYLPEADNLPISNISISGSLDIKRSESPEPFDATLQRVRECMAVWAKTCYGAAPALNAEKITRLGYNTTKKLMGALFSMGGKSGKTYPWFTNIGIIDESRLAFGDDVPCAGHMFGPAAGGASVVCTASTYRDTLTACMGFCADAIDADIIQGLLEQVMGELRSLRVSKEEEFAC